MPLFCLESSHDTQFPQYESQSHLISMAQTSLTVEFHHLPNLIALSLTLL